VGEAYSAGEGGRVSRGRDGAGRAVAGGTVSGRMRVSGAQELGQERLRER